MFRDLNGMQFLRIHQPQCFIPVNVRVKAVKVKVLCQVYQVFHAPGMLSKNKGGFKSLQTALCLYFHEGVCQLIQFVNAFIFIQIVIEPQHVTVKAGNKNLGVAFSVNPDFGKGILYLLRGGRKFQHRPHLNPHKRVKGGIRKIGFKHGLSLLSGLACQHFINPAHDVIRTREGDCVSQCPVAEGRTDFPAVCPVFCPALRQSHQTLAFGFR